MLMRVSWLYATRVSVWLVAISIIFAFLSSHLFAEETIQDINSLLYEAEKNSTAQVKEEIKIKSGANDPLQGDSTRTRFLIGLDKTVPFKVLALSNPNRVVVELPEVALRLPKDPGNNPAGLVKSFRSGQSGPGKIRIVIDVIRPVVVEKARIVTTTDGKVRHLNLEIVPIETLAKSIQKPFKSPPFALGGSGVQPPVPQPAKNPNEIKKSVYKPVIVIDPGHGGDDTGAVKNGTVEKQVVLAFAKVLREKIEKTGRYKVLMTRDSDVFIPLQERRAFAERNKAALFIAIHADYASTRARGATIYSLRDNLANSLKNSAKGEVKENVLTSLEATVVKKVSGEADVTTVKDILSDLAQREVETTHDRTSMFSRTVIEQMGETTNLRENPDQQAGFQVLKSAKVPSVLIELGYVTNTEDAALLKSDSWRYKVAESITTAVENYFSTQIARLPL
ncbi:MAG: N-acetylmuramoyl-L-alanine amidase [Hyphomicrobium sp.]